MSAKLKPTAASFRSSTPLTQRRPMTPAQRLHIHGPVRSMDARVTERSLWSQFKDLKRQAAAHGEPSLASGVLIYVAGITGIGAGLIALAAWVEQGSKWVNF